MVKSLKKGPRLINYEVHNGKVVQLTYSSKAFETRGWSIDDYVNEDETRKVR